MQLQQRKQWAALQGQQRKEKHKSHLQQNHGQAQEELASGVPKAPQGTKSRGSPSATPNGQWCECLHTKMAVACLSACMVTGLQTT
jgi:hypothetical protein